MVIKKHSIDENLSVIIKFNEEHAGELVLDYQEVVRLIGISPEEEDHYWVVIDYRGQSKHLSCISELHLLRGILPEKQYRYLDYFFKINNVFCSEEKQIGRGWVEVGEDNLSPDLSELYLYDKIHMSDLERKLLKTNTNWPLWTTIERS